MQLKTTLFAVLCALPAMAHHSFTMFDLAKRIPVTGKVTSFQWTNPHAYIEADCTPDAGGPMRHLSIELGSPSILQRAGWKFSTIKAGDSIKMVISPLKNGDAGGFLINATVPDGRTLSNGPAQPTTAAPTAQQ